MQHKQVSQSIILKHQTEVAFLQLAAVSYFCRSNLLSEHFSYIRLSLVPFVEIPLRDRKSKKPRLQINCLHEKQDD